MQIQEQQPAITCYGHTVERNRYQEYRATIESSGGVIDYVSTWKNTVHLAFHFDCMKNYEEWCRRQQRYETPIIEKRSDQLWRRWIRRVFFKIKRIGGLQ